VRSALFTTSIAIAAALAAPLSGHAASARDGFHANPGIRCQFGSDSVTCVASKLYEFQKACKSGDPARLWLHAKAGSSGCTKRKFRFGDTSYSLRSGGAVLSSDRNIRCALAQGQLTCSHTHRKGGFTFFVLTGNFSAQ
jgi:hypothetical protein